MFTVLILFACSAFADTPQEPIEAQRASEFLHQAPAKTFELTGDLEYDALKAKLNDGTSFSESKFMLTPTAEYGISHFVSLGLSLPYIWLRTPSDLPPPGTNAVSWGDPELYAKVRIDGVGPGSLRFQLTYAQTIGDATTGKNYSGGKSFTPAIAYEVAIDRHLFGLREEYKFYLGNRTMSYEDEAVYQVSGGESLTSQLFYEYADETLTYGFSFSLINQSASKFQATQTIYDQLLQQGTPAAFNGMCSPIGNAMNFQAYFPIDIVPNFRLIPRLSYTVNEPIFRSTYPSLYGQSGSASGWQIGSAARISF
jgi:hypothetical protein